MVQIIYCVDVLRSAQTYFSDTMAAGVVLKWKTRRKLTGLNTCSIICLNARNHVIDDAMAISQF